jgi:cell division septation protein DedD
MKDDSSFGRASIAFLLAVSIAVSVVGGGVVIADAAASGSGDAGDTRANATTIDGKGGSINGVIASDDADWYAVELENGQNLSVRLAVPGKRGEALRIGLYGPDGRRISGYDTSRGSQTPVAGNGSQTRASLDYTVKQSGTYYVKVTTVEESVRGKIPYTLGVTSQSSDNHDSTQTPDGHDSDERPSQTVPIETGETVRGTMTGGDRERFSLKTEKGETLSVETSFDGTSTSSGVVYIYDPDGERIHKSMNGDIQGITAENGGTYTIVLVSNSKSSTTLNYTVTATLTSNQSETTNRVQRIEAGDPVKNTITSTDGKDWYAVKIEKGQGFTVSLEHTNRENPTAEMSFKIHNPDGEKIGEAPFNRSLRAYQTSPAAASAYGGDVARRSGTYYIAVDGKKGANYSLTVNTVTLDNHDPNERPAFATPIKVGSTISGTLAGYDRDVYAIDLQKGESVTVEYNSTGSIKPALWAAGPGVAKKSGSPRDYSFGKYTIASARSDVGTDLTFTANRTGTYYLKVVPYFERSTAATFSERATYRMTVHSSKKSERTLTVNRLQTTATETVKLNTSIRTATQTPTQTRTPRSTATPTPTATSTHTAITQTTVTQSATENNKTPPQTTATGPGFGVLLALVGFGGGAWYRSRR